MTFKCDIIDLWTLGVPGFYICLKVSSFISLFSLPFCYCSLSTRPIQLLLWLSLFIFWHSVTQVELQGTANDKKNSSALSKSFFKLEMWNGFTVSFISSMNWPNLYLSLIKDRPVTYINLIYVLFLKTLSS